MIYNPYEELLHLRVFFSCLGVFSMDGTVAPLGAICELADKYNAIVFIDECHATGFLGNVFLSTVFMF